MQPLQGFKIEEKKIINKQARKKKVVAYQGKINVAFQYRFQDYLKFALEKIVPFANVVIDPREKLIHGLKQDCQKLKTMCEQELQNWSYKNLMFKKEIDIDQIDYLLNRQYQAKFFRQGYILRAINALRQYSGLQDESQEFAKRVVNKKIIIVRVNYQYEAECLKKIYRIIANNRGGPQQQSMMENRGQKVLNQTEETIVQEQDSINYYALLHQNEKKQNNNSIINASISSQLSTSSLQTSYCSLTITQINQTITHDDSLRTQNSKLQQSTLQQR